MNLVEIEVNRAIWFGELTPAGAQRLFGANLIRAFVERYGFIEAPKTAAEFDPVAGVIFRHGYFQGQIIQRFHVYNNGMLAEGKVDTDLCEAFLADVVKWAKQDVGIQFSETGLGRIYMSQLVVQSDVLALGTLSKLQQIIADISGAVSKDSAHNVPAQVSGFILQSDPVAGPGWMYRLERRAGRNFADNMYFSSAPLRTGVHLELLQKIEAMFSA